MSDYRKGAVSGRYRSDILLRLYARRNQSQKFTSIKTTGGDFRDLRRTR